jgi:hypothetical protein
MYNANHQLVSFETVYSLLLGTANMASCPCISPAEKKIVGLVIVKHFGSLASWSSGGAEKSGGLMYQASIHGAAGLLGRRAAA